MKIKVTITAEALGKEVPAFEAKPELTAKELNQLIITIQKMLNKLLVAQASEHAQDGRL